MRNNGEIHQLITSRFDRLEIKMDKLGDRVSALEVWKAEIVAKMTVVAGGIAIAISVATDWIKRKLFT